MKPEPKPEPQTLVSWWLDLPQHDFTARAEREQLARMRESRFGTPLSKPISTDELSR